MSTPGAYLRLARAGWVLVREGVVAALPGDQLSGLAGFGWRVSRALTRRGARKRQRTDRLADAVARLGPSYVKLGQFLATRPDVVGNDIALDLSWLQDKMETFPRAAAAAAIEGSLGRRLDDLYLSFGEPVAAASIAQVHAAEVLRDGAPVKVAVKVIRPGVRRRFNDDLESYFLAARLQEGQCYQELGDVKRALGLYNDLLGQPDELKTLRPYKASAMYLSLQCWTAESEKLYELASIQADEFIRASSNDELIRPEWLAVRYYGALANELYAATLPADAKGQEAP